IAEWVAPSTNFIGNFLARITGTQRWRALSHVALETVVRRLAATPANALPDLFLLEIYNPEEVVVRMQLSFSPVPAETQSEPKLVRILPNLTCTVSCPPGYSRHEIDFDQLRGVINSGHPFVVQIIPEADSQARLVFLAADFVRLAADAARRSNKAIKCVVFDLDNTLWKGILIE